MEWIKAIFAIIFFAGVLVFLPLESTAQEKIEAVEAKPVAEMTVVGDKVVITEPTKEAEVKEYDRKDILAYQKLLTDRIATDSVELEKINAVVKQLPEVKEPVVIVKPEEQLTGFRKAIRDARMRLSK